MTRALACVILLAACGGKAAAPTTPVPTTMEPEPVATEPVPTTTTEPSADATAVCANRNGEFGPYQLTEDQAAKRHGQNATRYTDAPATKEQPIEVCGVPAQQEWLMRVSCADGSKAFSSANQVRTSRAGSVGPGGRCGSIIDRYVAKCPEAQYDVFIDMYMCGPGESM